MKKPLGELAAAEAARRIAAADTTAEALAAACLERIAARDEAVRAWAFVDRSRALAQARALDRMPRRRRLHGVPTTGVPCVSVPHGKGAHGLPLAVQLVGAFDADTALLGRAHWVEGILG